MLIFAVNTRPATTAKMVAKAIADTKANKKSPPNALANKGAAILPAGFALIIASFPTNAPHQILRKSS